MIRSLLAEAGRARLGTTVGTRAVTPGGLVTPETYLGSARAERFDNGAIRDGVHRYGRGAPDLPPDHLAYRGTWGIAQDGAVAGPGARLYLNFHARNVYLVLGSPDRARTMQVLLDGRPLRTVRVDRQRLYTLVSLPKSGDHMLELRPQNGTRGYAFTFG